MKLDSSTKKCRCSKRKRSLEMSRARRTLKRMKPTTRNKSICHNGDRICTVAETRHALIEGSDFAKKTYDVGTQVAGCSSNGSERVSLLLEDQERTRPPRKRWDALALFCALTFAQCCIGNTWGPIATSAMLAFPSWQKSAVALLSNWGCIAYLSCCLPSCWFLNRSGLQAPLRLAAVTSTVATFLRCLTSQESIFTISAHLAAILNGMSGVLIGPSAALVSATWFPRGERTTATGISACFNQLGVAGSYLIGPTIVKAPTFYNTSNSTDNEAAGNGTEHSSIRGQVMFLMRIEFFAYCLILVAFLLFFPAADNRQHSGPAPRGSNYSLFDSISHLTQFYVSSNKSIWRLCGAAALSQGVTGPWLAMISMAFASSVTQDEADRLAFWTVILGSALGVFASRLMDIFQGYLKIAIFVLLVASSIMFFWVLLLDRQVLAFNKSELYTAVALGVSSSWATPALFLELASEIAFPVSEAIVGGYMIFLANLIGAIFYFSYFVPDMSERWSSYWVFGSLTTASILVMYVNEEYNRTPAICNPSKTGNDQATTAKHRS